MNLSGILVTAQPGHVDRVAAELARLPGIQVSQADTASGRIVVVQEAPDVGAEVQAFGRIRALPHVLGADLVCHCFEDDHEAQQQAAQALPARASHLSNLPGSGETS